MPVCGQGREGLHRGPEQAPLAPRPHSASHPAQPPPDHLWSVLRGLPAAAGGAHPPGGVISSFGERNEKHTPPSRRPHPQLGVLGLLANHGLWGSRSCSSPSSPPWLVPDPTLTTLVASSCPCLWPCPKPSGPTQPLCPACLVSLTAREGLGRRPRAFSEAGPAAPHLTSWALRGGQKHLLRGLVRGFRRTRHVPGWEVVLQLGHAGQSPPPAPVPCEGPHRPQPSPWGQPPESPALQGSQAEGRWLRQGQD